MKVQRWQTLKEEGPREREAERARKVEIFVIAANVTDQPRTFVMNASVEMCVRMRQRGDCISGVIC